MKTGTAVQKLYALENGGNSCDLFNMHIPPTDDGVPATLVRVFGHLYPTHGNLRQMVPEMNYLTQMLLNQPAVHVKAPPPPPLKPYHRNKVKAAHRGSYEKYRLFMTKQRRTIPEIAEHMGYTYFGARASILRMLDRGHVKKVKPRTPSTKVGRTPDLYTWVPH